MRENNLNINMLQAKSELAFCHVVQVLSLEKNLAPSYTQRAYEPEERSSLMPSHSDGDPSGISEKQACECFWHLAHPDICNVPHEDCFQLGYHGNGDDAGALAITIAACPLVHTPEIPTQHIQPPRTSADCFQEISHIYINPKKGGRKKYVYIEKPISIPGMLPGECLTLDKLYS